MAQSHALGSQTEQAELSASISHFGLPGSRGLWSQPHVFHAVVNKPLIPSSRHFGQAFCQSNRKESETQQYKQCKGCLDGL